MASRNASRPRKRRRSQSAPRAVSSSRRAQRAARQAQARHEVAAGNRVLGRVGERPGGMFGGLPVSELAILCGIIAVVVGITGASSSALLVGIIVCALGVVELTAREHFSGYRSHTALLAGIPAVAIEAGIVFAFGEPRQRPLLLVPVVPIFLVLFWALRRRFLVARQARIARPSIPR